MSAARWLEGPALWDSLAQAVVAMVKGRRGIRLGSPDLTDLKDMVATHAPEVDREFWRAQSGHRSAGLLRHEPEVKARTTKGGVIFWDEWQDDAWRVVDPAWLVSHADIYQWITQPLRGRYCRHCGMGEVDTFSVLQPIEFERRNGETRVNGIVVLQPSGVALTHERCRPYHLEWLALVKPYRNVAEAIEVDRAAGHKPRLRPALRASDAEEVVNA